MHIFHLKIKWGDEFCINKHISYLYCTRGGRWNEGRPWIYNKWHRTKKAHQNIQIKIIYLPQFFPSTAITTVGNRDRFRQGDGQSPKNMVTNQTNIMHWSRRFHQDPLWYDLGIGPNNTWVKGGSKWITFVASIFSWPARRWIGVVYVPEYPLFEENNIRES